MECCDYNWDHHEFKYKHAYYWFQYIMKPASEFHFLKIMKSALEFLKIL